MRTGLSIFMMLFALGVLGNPIRSNVGATHIAYGEQEEPQTYTASDYVQDGLVAMWDGIANTGWNKHNQDSVQWVDLVGDKHLSLTVHGRFSNNALICDGEGYAAKDGKNFDRQLVRTIEIVIDSYSGSGIIASIAGSGSTASAIRITQANGNLVCMNVLSVSSGLSNIIKLPAKGKFAISLLYDDIDFLGGYVNGEWQNSFYAFSGTASANIAFGGRSEYGDNPWEGRIHCVRIYNRALSSEEIEANNAIDQARFGL